MPGIFGVAGFTDPVKTKQLLASMGLALKDHDSYGTDLYSDADIALGCVHWGETHQCKHEPQPLWNEQETLCIVWDGELYVREPLRIRLNEHGVRAPAQNDAALVLSSFEAFGASVLPELNGAFTLAIWNANAKELIVANDRLGLRPLYVTTYNNGLVFACGVRGLLADETLPRTLDHVAIAQALSFEYVLGARTYLTNVKLLDPATILRFANGQCHMQQHWCLDYPDVLAMHTREEYLEQLTYLLRQAAMRSLTNCDGVGINLSGGLDSRMLLGLLTEICSSADLQTFTYGVVGCSDMTAATRLARVAGTRHRSYSLEPDYLQRLAAVGVRVSDGMESCAHMHALANVEDQAKSVQHIYTGFLIDALISPDATREWLGHYDDETSLGILFADIHRLFKPGLDDATYTPEFRAACSEGFQESFRQEALAIKSHLLSDWQTRMELLHRQRRCTQFGNDLLRWRVNSCTPFCDGDLVTFCLNLPPAMRLDRYIFIEALKQMFHSLAKVPLDKTGLPLVAGAESLGITATRQARWYLHNHGIGGQPVYRYIPYNRYDLWMRTPLRSWVESLLLAKAFYDRGIFRAEAVRKIVDAHMSGAADYSRELGMMLSIELWHRQYID